MIRSEQSNPMALINTHNLIANDPQLAPRYLASQEQEITHFQVIFRLLGDDIMQACLRRWSTFPYSLKIRVPLSSKNERSTEQATHVQEIYSKAQSQLDWLETQSTTALSDARRKEEEEERRQWDEVEKKVGFYAQEEETTSDAWDVREATRAMKDMDID